MPKSLDTRRSLLKGFVKKQMIRTQPTAGVDACTHLHAFLTIVGYAAGLAGVERKSFAQVLTADLQSVLIGEDHFRRQRRGAHYAGDFPGSTGFRTEFQAIREAIFATVAGLLLGTKLHRQPSVAGYALRQAPTPAHRRLYEAVLPVGAALNDDNFDLLSSQLFAVLRDGPDDLGIMESHGPHGEAIHPLTVINVLTDDSGRLKECQTAIPDESAAQIRPLMSLIIDLQQNPRLDQTIIARIGNLPKLPLRATLSTALTAGVDVKFFNDVCKPRTGEKPRLSLAQAGEFIYLDCGRWGDKVPKQRNFGLVWGPHAVLCEFVPRRHGIPQEIPESTELSRLIESLSVSSEEGDARGVRVLGHLRCRTPREPAPAKKTRGARPIYVLIPDLHLPQTTAPVGTKRNRPGGVLPEAKPNQMPQMLITNPMTYEPGTWWEQRVLETNLFGDGTSAATGFGEAGNDLIELLDRLVLYSGAPPVQVVQLGDMYELWWGLSRFFMSRDDAAQAGFPVSDVGIHLKRDARDVVNEWAKRIHIEFSPLFDAFSRLARKWPATYLHGNHDNYFSTYCPPGVPQRQTAVRQDGLYAEHGHNHGADRWNEDGAVEGYENAQRYFKRENVVLDGLELPLETEPSLDPNRRHFHTTAAAWQFAENPDFNVYVMGHTHSPYLSRICVHVKLDRSQ